MKLSIITINRNDAAGLEKTIKSVLAQSFLDYEYIVIDGDSTDGSKEVLERYRSRLTFALSEPDSGIYNAMNKGASHASGDYLQFLNSGDELYDTETLARVFSGNPTEEILCGMSFHYNTPTDFCILTAPRNISLYTFIESSLHHPASFIKRNLFNQLGGYHEEFRMISDWCFFVEALIDHGASYRPLDIVVSRFNTYGLSSTQPGLEKEESLRWLRNKYPRILDDYAPLEDEAIFNVAYYVSGKQGFAKRVLVFPFKAVNSLLKLRHRLSKRHGILPKREYRKYL